jgi:hypothetical protein
MQISRGNIKELKGLELRDKGYDNESEATKNLLAVERKEEIRVKTSIKTKHSVLK